ncbi:MAG: SGNH/GDSL hydrolase family protein [Ramlibacter sp.]
MSRHWIRRALLALASASVLLVAACGSGTIESQLQPTRIVSFGDAMSDLGQTGTRYTVNDSSLSIWTEAVAFGFALPLNNAKAGGASYAQGNVRINAKPDAAGRSDTPTVKEQIDTFLAGNAFVATDLVIVGAGTSDIIAETAQLNAATQSADQMLADVAQAGRDLGVQVRRLVKAGAQHVVVVGPYDLGKSPWATSTAQTARLSQASGKFNEQLLLSIVDLGANVLYVDAALQFNLMAAFPTSYELVNAIEPVCTSIDVGPGIGIGANQINSAVCSTSTVLAGATYNLYLFADRVYPTPQGQRKFGDYAYQRIRARW